MTDARRLRPPLTAIVASLAVLLVGAAAVGLGLVALSQGGSPRTLAIAAAAALAGAGCAVSALRWGVLLFSAKLRRTYAGSRAASAYVAWTLWTALFLYLSYQAGTRFGPAAGMGLAALTLHFGVRHLDLLPRLVLHGDALVGPFLPRLPLESVEAWELRELPEKQLLCLRLLVRGDTSPVTEWLSPTQRPALERLLSGRRITPRKFHPPAAPPVL